MLLSFVFEMVIFLPLSALMITTCYHIIRAALHNLHISHKVFKIVLNPLKVRATRRHRVFLISDQPNSPL